MAIVTAIVLGYRIEHGFVPTIALVIDQCPGPLQGGGSKIIAIAAYRVTGGVADRAVDAFDAFIGDGALRRGCIDGNNGIVTGCTGMMHPFRLCPFVKKRIHVGDQILDDRQVSQRGNLQFAVDRCLLNVGSTGPSRLAIDHHRTGPAHADPAGEAIGQCAIKILLNIADDIEHRLAFLTWHVELLKSASFIVGLPPNGYGQNIVFAGQPSVLQNSLPFLYRDHGFTQRKVMSHPFTCKI